MHKKTAASDAITYRVLPDTDAVARAIAFIAARPPQPQTLTIQWKISRPTTRKKKLLLHTSHLVTNLASSLLRHYAEEYTAPRTDGAVARVLSLPSLSSHRSRMLGAQIAKEHGERDDSARYLLASRIREGVYRNIATTLIIWVQNIASMIRQENPEEGQQRRRNRRADVLEGMTVDMFYDGWRKLSIQHEAASKAIIPFGRHKGAPLGEIGRREARWLLSRLLSREELTATLRAVETLLEQSPALLHDEAFLPYPYHTRQESGKTLQASHLVHRIVTPRIGDPTLLGMLTTTELLFLRVSLQEELNSGASRDLPRELIQLPPIIEDAIDASAAMDTLEGIFNVFLHKRPACYPVIAEVDEYGKRRVDDDELIACLNWFRPNPDRHDDAEKYRDEMREAGARDRLMRAFAQTRPALLQPIPFVGTFNPYPQPKKRDASSELSSKKHGFRDYALLFDESMSKWFFAAKLRGKAAPTDSVQQQRERPAQRAVQRTLYYANYPKLIFSPERYRNSELFCLEWGEESGRSRFVQRRVPLLHNIITLQHHVQQDVINNARRAGYDEQRVHRASTDVPSAFTVAKIVPRECADGEYAFFVHIATNVMPDQERIYDATRVMGIHEHDDGYSYAVVGYDGRLVYDEAGMPLLGDVPLPAHVDPRQGAVVSDNYKYEMALSILAQSNAYVVGIEDTRYKYGSSVSRSKNGATFRRPAQAIRDIVVHKALLQGRPKPIMVTNISPARDCGHCGARTPKEAIGTFTKQCCYCSACGKQYENMHTDTHRCVHCGADRHWLTVSAEQWFTCAVCHTSTHLARLNTALAVAQQTLCQISSWHAEKLRLKRDL